MALSAGSVTVANDGSRTGSGLALAFYDKFTESLSAPADDAEAQLQLTSKRACAGQCGAMASAIIDYFKANAELTGNAHVSDQVLGRTPSPNNANTAIQPPSSPVDIPLSGGLA